MEGASESIAKMRPLMTNMNTKREYTHEDMEELGVVINELKIIARQVDQDVASGRITHLREDIAHERKLRLEAEAKLAMLEASKIRGSLIRS